MRPKCIVLLEDDHIQAESFVNALKQEYRRVTVEVIATEKDFVKRLNELVASPPDLFILDVMVRWTDPSPKEDPVPEEAKGEGFFRAGLRCEKKLRDRKCDVPIILYTLLQEEDLGDEMSSNPRTKLILKDADFAELYAAINSF